LKDRIEYIAFILLSYFLRVIGLKLARKFAFFLALLFYNLIPIRKKTVFENLDIAFPEMSFSKKKKIAFQSYYNFCISVVEILLLPYLSKEKVKTLVKTDKVEFLKRKYEEKKGLILISAHFSNWEYIAASVSLQMEIPFNIIVKNQRNRFVNDWLNMARTKWINKVIPLGLSIRNAFNILKNGEILAVVADQRGPEEGLKLKFFGKETSVFTGPAVLSLKTGAPIVFGIPIRLNDFNYIAEIYELDMSNLPDDFNSQVKEICQRMVRFLEEIISKYPEQWLWMHKRWKH
jgi:KDO2-lipid IV(A) lauroyltransferase